MWGVTTARSPQVQQLLSSYTDICHAAATGTADTSDEFLYGRAGTLFGALLLRQQLGAAAVPNAAVGALVSSILASGGHGVQQCMLVTKGSCQCLCCLLST
jgi:hypothetical protein